MPRSSIASCSSTLSLRERDRSAWTPIGTAVRALPCGADSSFTCESGSRRETALGRSVQPVPRGEEVLNVYCGVIRNSAPLESWAEMLCAVRPRQDRSRGSSPYPHPARSRSRVGPWQGPASGSSVLQIFRPSCRDPLAEKPLLLLGEAAFLSIGDQPQHGPVVVGERASRPVGAMALLIVAEACGPGAHCLLVAARHGGVVEAWIICFLLGAVGPEGHQFEETFEAFGSKLGDDLLEEFAYPALGRDPPGRQNYRHQVAVDPVGREAGSPEQAV